MKVSNITWKVNALGIFTPNGISANSIFDESKTFLDIKEKAIRVETLFKNKGLDIPKTSSLANLIDCAKKLSDCWLCGEKEVDNSILWKAFHMYRISDSVFTIENDSDALFHLRKLINGNLDLLSRSRSEAKDFLWEIEFLHSLRKYGIKAELAEPPDIVVEFKGNSIGIACKKIHNEKNFEKVLSNGVSQISRDYDYGIVAINIDDTIPAHSLYSAKNKKIMMQGLSNINLSFMHRNERHLRKYLSSGRLISAVVSIAVIADLKEERIGLHNARQSTVWSIPGLTEEKKKVFDDFYNSITQNATYT